MKHLATYIIFIIAFLINSCAREHPTLDDFIIDDEIIIDAQDLLNDDRNKGVELEKDATGSIVASSNPSEELPESTNKTEDIVTIPNNVKPALIIPSAKVKELPKAQIHSGTSKKSEAVIQNDRFKPRIKNFTFTNEPIKPAFFDPNILGLHLLGVNTAEENVTTEVQSHNKAIMEMKVSYEERNLSKMRQWRDKTLIGIPRSDETLFYPFSGPDVVNMLTFFPNQQTYVMMGLEYVGTAETVTTWMQPLTKSRMDTIRKAVESVFIRSFFRTLDMSSDFSKNGTRGVLPGMLLMLKLLDRDIKSVQWITLNDDGSIHYLTPEATKTACTNFGIEIIIAHPTQGYDQTIYYFKSDLADTPMAENPALRSFIQRQLGTTMTFVKSASCLMHMKDFSWIRSTLLNISRAVLQDDTGVPFKYYKPTQWKHHLYGQYVGPYGESFAAFKQPDLIKEYESIPLQLLDFNMGYGYSKIPAHLMLFIRKE
jgi:hypothetical protein